MRISWIGRFGHAFQRVRSKLLSKAIILLYHRVAELECDPQLLAVTPQHFSEHLQILRRYTQPMRLQELVQTIKSGDLPDRAAIVTFDDGYADNLHNAKLLLENFEIPATVFVAADKVDSKEEFWWDELERVFLATPEFPYSSLELTINGKRHLWSLETDGKNAMPVEAWNVLKDCELGPRQSIYTELVGILRRLRSEQRDALLAQLAAWSKLEKVGRSWNLPLSTSELCSLADGKLVEIGCHTMTHSVLSLLDKETQRIEIADSKEKLERILGQPIDSFSYPFGGFDDYTGDTVQLVKAIGFHSACSNFPSLVNKRTDLFQLPRFVVRDWNGDEFEQRIKAFFAGG